MPESHFEVLDERFRRVIRRSAFVERLYGGCRWAEGPVWFPAHRSLVWSDIPNNRMLRWDEPSGQIGVFRQPSNYANGNTLDRQGRLVTCEHGRRVTRTEHDGSITVLADAWQGKRLNSPNDVVVRSDGSIWFTDPTYGIDSDYEGDKAPGEIGSSNVYRIDGATGAMSLVTDDFVQPNGLAFSLDERRLFIVDTGASHVPGHPRHMRVFDFDEDGRLGADRVFAESPAGFDGFRLDADGRIWAATGEGVNCYAPDGDLIGKVLTPEPAANVCFGGPKRNWLFICATTSLYVVHLAVNGAPLF